MAEATYKRHYTDLIGAESLHDDDVFAVIQPGVPNEVTEVPGVTRGVTMGQTAEYAAQHPAVAGPVAGTNERIDNLAGDNIPVTSAGGRRLSKRITTRVLTASTGKSSPSTVPKRRRQ
jgi:hypothetical protein